MDIAPCRTFIFINHPFQDAEISGQVAFAESRALELDAELKRQRLAQATPTTWLNRWGRTDAIRFLIRLKKAPPIVDESVAVSCQCSNIFQRALQGIPQKMMMVDWI